MLISQGIQRHLTVLEATGKRRSTLKAARNRLGKFLLAIGDKECSSVTPDDLLVFQLFLRRQNKADRSVYQYTSLAITFLKRTGHIVKCEMPNYVEKEPVAYTREQMRRLFAVCTPPERLLFEFFLVTGCREQEVMYGTWDCILWGQKLFKVAEKREWNWRPKDSEERLIPLTDSLLSQLEQVRKPSGLLFPNRDGKPNGHQIRKLQQIARRSGQDPNEFWLHKFRASMCSWHHENGMSANSVRKIAGHASLQTTLRYLQAADLQSEQTRRLVNSTFVGLS